MTYGTTYNVYIQAPPAGVDSPPSFEATHSDLQEGCLAHREHLKGLAATIKYDITDNDQTKAPYHISYEVPETVRNGKHWIWEIKEHSLH